MSESTLDTRAIPGPTDRDCSVADSTGRSGKVMRLDVDTETGGPVQAFGVATTDPRDEMLVSGNAERRRPNPD